jgi:hypothetical protein
LAEKEPTPNTTFQGLLLSKDYTYTLLDPRDLGEFTGLSTSVVVQTQRVAITVGLELVRWHLEGMFGNVADGVDKDRVRTLRVSRCYGYVLQKLTSNRLWALLTSNIQKKMNLPWSGSQVSPQI